jgi:hypothetical protein
MDSCGRLRPVTQAFKKMIEKFSKTGDDKITHIRDESEELLPPASRPLGNQP